MCVYVLVCVSVCVCVCVQYENSHVFTFVKYSSTVCLLDTAITFEAITIFDMPVLSTVIQL